MWIRFNAPYSYKPKAAVTMVFKSGDTYNAPRELAERAIADKAAVEMRKATRSSEPTPVTTASDKSDET